MAMNGSVMANAILTAMNGVPIGTDPVAYRTALWTAIADAIVVHIQEFAQVAVTVASVSGVTTGGGASGPGSGTGTIE